MRRVLARSLLGRCQPSQHLEKIRVGFLAGLYHQSQLARAQAFQLLAAKVGKLLQICQTYILKKKVGHKVAFDVGLHHPAQLPNSQLAADHIKVANALEGLVERVKNRKPRQVLLNDRALNALRRAKATRAIIKLKTEFVFPPAQGNDMMLDAQGPTGYLHAAVAALGIRRRRQYDTRHTYATMCLMAGMNIAFIANQLGHTVEVLLSTYAEWINSAGDWSELAKLSMPENGTKVVQKESADD